LFEDALYINVSLVFARNFSGVYMGVTLRLPLLNVDGIAAVGAL
jgi:hypothetical protein